MCASVHVAGRRDFIGTVGELVELIGSIQDLVHDEDTMPSLRDCLCSIEVAETLVGAGYRVWRSGVDSMRYECDLVEEERREQ